MDRSAKYKTRGGLSISGFGSAREETGLDSGRQNTQEPVERYLNQADVYTSRLRSGAHSEPETACGMDVHKCRTLLAQFLVFRSEAGPATPSSLGYLPVSQVLQGQQSPHGFYPTQCIY